MLVSHLAISCRDPKRFEPTIATRGSRGRGDYRGVGVLYCCAVLCCCVSVVLLSGGLIELQPSRYTTGLNPTAYTVRLHFEGPGWFEPQVQNRPVTHSQNPVRGARQGHRRFFDRWWCLTPFAFFKPPDKPVSGSCKKRQLSLSPLPWQEPWTTSCRLFVGRRIPSVRCPMDYLPASHPCR